MLKRFGNKVVKHGSFCNQRYHLYNCAAPYQLELISEDRIILATFNSNVANFLNHQSLQDWNQMLDEIENTSNKSMYDRKPIIITSPMDSKHFGSGMDLKSVAKLTDIDANKQLFGQFEQTVKRLMTLQHRTIAKIHGNAIAGGFIFSLACDVRCGLLSNDIRLGINGIDVGLSYPSIAFLLLLQRIPQYANKLLNGQTNQLFDASQGLKYGYLTEVADNNDKLMDLCIEEALRIDDESLNAYLSVKRYLFDNCIRNKWENEREDVMNEFVRVKNTQESQRRIESMIHKLKQKS